MKWQPLPKIAHGIAIYPFTPSIQQSSSGTLLSTSRPTTAYSVIQSPLLSPGNDAASIFTATSSSSAAVQDHNSTNPTDYACLIPLEVGDELFILEQQGQWYRGYVVSALEEGKKPNIAPIGCFPRSHVQIKEYIDLDPAETDVAAIHRTDSLIEDGPFSPTAPWSPPDLSRSLSESQIRRVSSIVLEPPILGRPRSMVDRIDEDVVGHVPAPSLMLARFDQSTITGSSEPLVDEIGACVSEWNCLLYKYLEERRYGAFNSVRDHINYLFQARRQLLDQALSKEELSRLRKEIIHRMVMVNLSQNREMIVRHPERGYILDANSTSLPMLLRMHWKYALAEHIPLTSTFQTASRPSNTPSIKPSTPTIDMQSPQVQQSPLQLGHNQQQQQQQQQQQPAPKGAKFHHLFFEYKACVAHICQQGEFSELYFSLYNSAENRFLTEQFLVVLTFNGMPTDERQIGKLQTLFADLTSHDLNEHLYLVCRIVRLGNMKYSDKEKDSLATIGSHASTFFGGGVADHQRIMNKNQATRRPFGCAVLHLGPLLQKTEQSPGGASELMSPGGVTSSHGSTTSSGTSTTTGFMHIIQAEHDIPIYTATSESTFHSLHEDIIQNNVKDYIKNSRAEMVCIFLRMFFGQLDDVLKTNAALLQDVPRTLRLGFPDVVFPNDNRNDLYITLNAGDFVQFARSRNIQVTICARDNISGDVIENALSAGAGAPCMTYWDSIVYYHEQRPRWNETLKLQMKENRQWERAHLFITVRHRSKANASSPAGSPGEATGSDKTVCMGFLPLFLPPFHRYFVADGVHTLVMYKYDRQLAHPRIYLDNVAWCQKSSAPFNMHNQELAVSVKTKHQHSSSIYSLKSTHRAYSSTTSVYNSSSSNSITSDSQQSINDTSAATKLVAVKDNLTVATFLCSTRFTQNETLVKLLNWRSVLNEKTDGYDELLQILDKFTFVGEMEVVKFLNDIFDALLDIMTYRHKDSNKGERVSDESLGAIIWVLGIVQDRRFSNFRPVLDVYVEQRFSVEEVKAEATGSNVNSKSGNISSSNSNRRLRLVKDDMVYDLMLKGMLRLCANPSESKKAKRLRSAIKVWEYLFRFIVRSRGMQQRKEEDGERGLRDIMFKEELQQLLESISAMMSPDQPSVMIGTQTLALQHFADILGELRRVFSPKQLVETTTAFVDGCSHVTGKLIGYRLCMILAIVKGPVFNDHTCRSGLAKSVFRWINVWLNSYMAAAKNIIFSRQNDANEADHQQMRLPRVQWLEYLRLSLTIVSEVLDKVRKLSGMSSLGLSSGSMSPSLSTWSRPISMATSGDEEITEESQLELMSITEIALQLMPQLMNAYKDLQRLTIQAIHATGMGTAEISAGLSQPVRTNSRHSISIMRDRSNSLSLRHPPSVAISKDMNEGSSKFSVVLQALATSPTVPFPATYPFQATSTKNNPSLVATGNLAAMVTTGLFDITVVLLELFYLTPRQQWIDYLHNMYESDGSENMAAFLRQVVHVCMGILFGDSMQKLEESNAKDDSMHHEQDVLADTRKLPDHWLNLSVIAHKIVLCDVLGPAVSIFELSELQSDGSKETETAVEDLWRTFFVGLLRVMSSPRLEIEDFLPQTQRVVWKLADNMKGSVGAKSLLSLWKFAGPRQKRTPVQRMKMNGMGSVTTIAEEDRFQSAKADTGDDSEKYNLDMQVPRMNDEQKAENGPENEIHVSYLQLALIPVILRPLCGVSLTLHDKVRSTAVSIIADIIAIELHTFGELSRVQNLLISTIDLLVMTDHKGDETIKNKLIPELYGSLEKRLREQNAVNLLEAGLKVVDSIYKFLDLLLKIRGLPLDNDEFVEDRISATLKLMEFIQVIKREDIYIKYVHQLVGLHLSSSNYVEAALTLQFHANLLAWDPHEEQEPIIELNIPAQSAFSRKDKLYKDMLSYLEKGNAWEICIKLCKELAIQYETVVFDYAKLSDILQRQAQYALDISKKERYFPEYFRVAFYGRGFPASIRHVQFIYRGLEWEKMASFVERMQNQHPNAQLLSGKYATATVLNEDQLRELDNEIDAQFLHITAVTAEPSNVEMMENPLVPENIKKYYGSNDVWRFSYSRPFDKDHVLQQAPPEASKPEIDFLNLWTLKTVFTCEESFPSTARRSKVVSVEEMEISPIENAVLAMENKNEELLALSKKYGAYVNQRQRSVNVSPFSMALNGAVDAPVNGGVSLYKKAFLTDWYWEKNPEMRSWVRRLKTAINDQVEIIEQCLETHRHLVSQDMRPFHKTVVEFFKKNFKEEIEYLHKFKDTQQQSQYQQQQQNQQQPLLTHESHSQHVDPSGAGHTSISPLSREPTQEQQRPTLLRQNSTASSISMGLPPSLPMSPVFSSMRSPSADARPPSLMMDITIPDDVPEPIQAPSRAESISRSLKMSLRKKKRPPI